MIVVDANILIRAILGRQVRQLLDRYASQGVRFFAPDLAFEDAQKYLPAILKKRGKNEVDGPEIAGVFADNYRANRPRAVHHI